MNEILFNNNYNKIDDEANIHELLKIISKYKFSIFIITFLAVLFAASLVYFKTPKYSADSLIEIKSAIKENVSQGDFIGETFNHLDAGRVDKEIEILKTFHVNNLALNKVYFDIQFYKHEAYKKIEIFDNLPISIKDLNITNQDIIGKTIKFIPNEKGYYLEIKQSYKNKLLYYLFKKDILTLQKYVLYPYDKTINTPYFSCKIQKNKNLRTPLYFVINGGKRELFEKIKKNLEVTQTNEFAPLIRIEYTDTNSNRAAMYVNALVDSFILQSVKEKSKSSNRIIDFIDSQLVSIKEELKKNEDRLEAYRIKYRAVQPTVQSQIYIQQLTNLDLEISKNDLRRKLISDLINFSGKQQNLVSIAPALKELNDDPTLNLVTSLQEAQIEMEGLRAKYSKNHPDVLSLNNRIRNIKQKIIFNLKKLKSNIISRNENLIRLKNLYDTKLKSIPTHERKLLNLKRDHEVSSGIYKYLLQKKAESEMANVAILSDYRVIDRAFSNNTPIGAKPLAIFLASLLLGFILGIIQALIRNYLNDKIMSKEDIESETDLPIYASLPQLKQRDVKLEVLKKPKSPFSECFRNLRTNLQFSEKGEKCNVVLITSTIMGEGKSTTTANLSAIFQIASYKSIVINLDMRKPTLHTYFDIDNSYGMSTYLSGKNNIDDIIFPTNYENLHIIPSGPIPPNPSELILSDKLEYLIDNLKEVYDYIFIDSAPIGLVTDTMNLMKYSDMNLVIVRQNYSKKSFLTDLNNLIASHNLKHIGIVLNGVDASSNPYGYGYGD